jgi:hypothetical protein
LENWIRQRRKTLIRSGWQRRRKGTGPRGAITLFGALAISGFLAACGGNGDQPAPDATPTPAATPVAAVPAPGTTPAPGEKPLDAAVLVKERCTVCHNIERIELAMEERKFDAPGWEQTVDRMLVKGAKLEKAEREAVLKYLTQP